MWFRKRKEERKNQIRDLEIAMALLYDVVRLNVFENIPSATKKVHDATTDIRKYIDSFKKGPK